MPHIIRCYALISAWYIRGSPLESDSREGRFGTSAVEARFIGSPARLDSVSWEMRCHKSRDERDLVRTLY